MTPVPLKTTLHVAHATITTDKTDINYSQDLIFYLNGTRVKLHNPDPSLTLLQYIRSTGLTGTKLGCAEGGCGACTVLVSSFNQNTQRVHHTSVNACLAPLVSMANRHVITTEGIGNANNPHPVQERIALSHGSQCGFCTPGIVMALYALLRNHPRPTIKEIEEGFDGNLCRCTGYRPILDAARTFAVDACCGGADNDGTCCSGKSNGKGESTTNGKGPAKPAAKLNGCAMGTACCKNTPDLSNSEEASTTYQFPKVDFKKYDPSQELIFPPTLIKTPLVPLAFESKTKKWFRPTTLGELFALKSQYPNAKLVAGNSEIGIEVKFKRLVYPVNIYVSDISELRSVEWLDNGLRVGANLTINGFQKVLEEAVETMPQHKTEAFRAFLENIRWFAGNQIRNVATLAGNIATASPISDLNPVFVASNAVLTVVHPDDGAREIAMTDFFLGYRQTRLTAPDVICNIFIPFSREGEYVRAYKQAKRRDDDIAIANAGLRVVIGSDTRKVTDATFAYGGLGPTTIQAKVAVKNLIGQTWGDSAVFDRMVTDLPVDLPLSFGSPGGMPAFRKALSGSFLYKFWNDVGLKIGLTEKDGIDPQAVVNIEREPSTSWRSFEHLNPQRVVGQPIPHLSAIKQVTGEAIYTDDIPRVHNEVYAALVMSQKPRAKILSVDASEALEVDGVIDYVSLKDLPGNNIWGGGPTKDEQLFADGEVFCVGQTIGLILAENQMIAQHAARLVKVEYEVLPHILTIQEAIAVKSFYPPRPSIQRGDTAKGFEESYKIFEGDVHLGGQEQFYLETQASLVVPKGEDDEMEIFSSTQNATETQLIVASALGVPSNRIYCRVKRLGGGFGGKETRSVPLAATLAVAAKKLRRPVRCMLDRDEDMITSGQRHPFYAKYKVGVSKEGKVLAYELDIYNNAGWTADLSQAVLERSLSHCDNCYYIPNVHVRGYMCKTNIHSNTAFRGFGGPQGMFVAETWVEEVADGMGIPVEKFREMNLYKEGQLTHFNQELTDWNLPPLYYEVKKSSEYDRRRKEIDEFNNKSRWLKRGLSIIPTKFGISFTALHMNQAGALVHIYEDGSILLSHGGVEMGQGLHTKMVQVCAQELGVPIDIIHISETATTSVANTSPTAASAGSDLNGMAIKNACDQLNERLAPFRETLGKNASMKDLAHAAYFNRVNLTANGYYKTPDIGYKWGENTGMMFFYFTLGAAVSEVEVDVLTGHHNTLRTDIMMDIGRTINYAIDVGQIEGGFVQGAGLFTVEETLFFPNGQLFSRGPGNYKIPGFRDIPQDLRLSLYEAKSYPHLKTIQSSKGIGEPPLFLGSSVFFAIRDAIKAARKEFRVSDTVHLASPATPERIRVACADRFVQCATIERKEGERSFFVSLT